MGERELFEHNFPKPKDIYWCKDLNGYNYIDRGRGNPYAYDNLISYRFAWEAWQSSANRQGYKIVPVNELIRKAQNIRALNTGEYASDEIEENVCEIEAMIGEETK